MEITSSEENTSEPIDKTIPPHLDVVMENVAELDRAKVVKDAQVRSFVLTQDSGSQRELMNWTQVRYFSLIIFLFFIIALVSLDKEFGWVIRSDINHSEMYAWREQGNKSGIETAQRVSPALKQLLCKWDQFITQHNKLKLHMPQKYIDTSRIENLPVFVPHLIECRSKGVTSDKSEESDIEEVTVPDLTPNIQAPFSVPDDGSDSHQEEVVSDEVSEQTPPPRKRGPPKRYSNWVCMIACPM